MAAASESTVPVGVSFAYRIQSEHPFIVKTGSSVLIASHLSLL